MENKSQHEKSAHQLVADEILGLNFELIRIGKHSFAVYAPNIRTFARMVRCGAEFEYKDEAQAIRFISDNSFNAAKYITYAILGKRYSRYGKIYGKLLFYFTYRKVLKATGKELYTAVEKVNDVVGLDFFGKSSALILGGRAIIVKPEAVIQQSET